MSAILTGDIDEVADLRQVSPFDPVISATPRRAATSDPHTGVCSLDDSIGIPAALAVRFPALGIRQQWIALFRAPNGSRMTSNSTRPKPRRRSDARDFRHGLLDHQSNDAGADYRQNGRLVNKFLDIIVKIGNHAFRIPGRCRDTQRDSPKRGAQPADGGRSQLM